jgi:hypothetical protein
MRELREFVKNDVRSFVRKQRLKAGLQASACSFGYVLGDFESRAEQVPACDFFRVIKTMASDEEIHIWHLNFQIAVHQMRNKNKVAIF